MLSNKTLNKSKERDNVVYETPSDLVVDIISLIDFSDGDVVLDPCRGDSCVFYNNFPNNVVKHWCEIEEKVDFFDFKEEVDWIIGNPPFGRLLTQWFEHSVKIARKGIVYIIPLHSYSCKRMKIIEDAGFYIDDIKIFVCWFGYPVSVCILKRGINPRKTLSKYKYVSPYKKHHNGKI